MVLYSETLHDFFFQDAQTYHSQHESKIVPFFYSYLQQMATGMISSSFS
jgi:hypothetical protein